MPAYSHAPERLDGSRREPPPIEPGYDPLHAVDERLGRHVAARDAVVPLPAEKPKEDLKAVPFEVLCERFRSIYTDISLRPLDDDPEFASIQAEMVRRMRLANNWEVRDGSVVYRLTPEFLDPGELMIEVMVPCLAHHLDQIIRDLARKGGGR